VTSQVSTDPTTPAPASAAEALAMVRAGLGYLAAADPAEMTAQAQAECLRGLEQNDAVSTAARARVLAALPAGHGYTADADYSPTSWLIHRTRVTTGAARAHLAWARRVSGHPRVIAALAEGDVLTESMARTICGWIDKIPRDCRDAADAILITAARAGAGQQDLAELAAEIYARSLHDTDDGAAGFEDRRVTLQTTLGGAGVVNGDLTPACAAVVTAVLESLAARRGGHPDPGPALPRRAAGGHPLAEKLHRDWRHISFARVLRTQALRTPDCCRARLPRHRPQRVGRACIAPLPDCQAAKGRAHAGSEHLPQLTTARQTQPSS
jgi:hypothetical protein